jgi:hypothetical protein
LPALEPVCSRRAENMAFYFWDRIPRFFLEVTEILSELAIAQLPP